MLGVKDFDKPFDDVKLDAEDYKILARAKTVQMLDLKRVKNLSDDGLKIIAGFFVCQTRGCQAQGLA